MIALRGIITIYSITNVIYSITFPAITNMHKKTKFKTMKQIIYKLFIKLGWCMILHTLLKWFNYNRKLKFTGQI